MKQEAAVAEAAPPVAAAVSGQAGGTGDATGVLNKILDKLVALEERVDRAEAGQRQFVPMGAPNKGMIPPGEAWAGLTKDEGNNQRFGSLQLELVDVEGNEVRVQQRFQPGHRVRVRADFLNGAADCKRVRKREEDGEPAVDDLGRPVYVRVMTPVTYGELVRRRNEQGGVRCKVLVRRPGGKGAKACGARYPVMEICPGCGDGPLVSKVLWANKDGEVKYKVIVPGMTNGAYGEGFPDSALEPW